jgi:hypothetical protein
MPQLVKTGQSISTRLALMRPKLAITTVVLQSAGLLCLIFVAFQMQPWLMQGNIWESIQEENCVQDLILKTGSRDDPKDQSFKLEAQATVGSDGWYQVNRGEKQCSGSCYRALAQQTAQNCWLNQLFPSCEISSGHCPAFTLDKTTKRVAVQLGTKVTQLKGGESIDFTCSGAGYDGVIQFKGDAPRCRRTVRRTGTQSSFHSIRGICRCLSLSRHSAARSLLRSASSFSKPAR